MYFYRKTLIINKEENNLLFLFLNYFIFFVIYNNTFEAIFAKNIKNIFRVQILLNRKSLILK